MTETPDRVCTDRPIRLCGAHVWPALAALLILLGANPVRAAADPAALCENAASIVAQETGVPRDVLLAISLTETGRHRDGRTRPWAWAVNMEGKGVWFETEADARAYVDEHFKNGARSFDVGCFQLNYKWHHQGFDSIAAMFDPVTSGRYAAGFLADLHREMGDWTSAAGAYHSRTPKYAERYIARFTEHRTALATAPAPAASEGEVFFTRAAAKPAPHDAQGNTFPLLRGDGGTPSAGSLVPLNRSRDAPRLIDFHGAG